VSEKCSSLDSFESALPRKRKSLLYIHLPVHRIAYICFKCTFGPNPRKLINFTLCKEIYFAKFSVYFFSLVSILYIAAQKRICLSHIACLDRYDRECVLYFLLTRYQMWHVNLHMPSKMDCSWFRWFSLFRSNSANYNRLRTINYLR